MPKANEMRGTKSSINCWGLGAGFPASEVGFPTKVMSFWQNEFGFSILSSGLRDTASAEGQQRKGNIRAGG